MTKEELIKEHDENRRMLVKKYGAYWYFISQDVLTLIKLEKMFENKGYVTKRKQFESMFRFYADIYNGDKCIASIQNIGTYPAIEFFEGCKEYAKEFVNEECIIAPIPGIHRVLDWHEVEEEKYHMLAGGQTILHVKPFVFTCEEVDEFLIGIHKDQNKVDEAIEKSIRETPQSMKEI